MIAFSINSICGSIALFNSLLLILYAKTLKGTPPLLGNLSIGYLTGSVFYSGASIFGFGGIKALSVLFLLAALAITAREIVKDIEDMEGDSLEGADTLPPLRIGGKKSGLSCGAYRAPCSNFKPSSLFHVCPWPALHLSCLSGRPRISCSHYTAPRPK